MTAPAEIPRSRSFLPWIMLIAGILIGYLFCRMTMEATAKLGNCVSPDTSRVLATGVTPDQCEAICDECSWTQGGAVR